MKITRLLVLAIVTVLLAANASAQSNPGAFELTPFGGYRFGGTFEEKDTDVEVELADDATFGVIFNIRESANTQWELIYSHQSTQADTSALSIGGQSLDIDLHTFQGGGTYQGEGNKVRPYLAATVGGTMIDPSLSSFDSEVFWSFSVGGGLNIRPTERLGFRVEARAFGTLLSADSDLFCRSGPAGGLCAITVQGSMLWQIETFAGVVFRF